MNRNTCLGFLAALALLAATACARTDEGNTAPAHASQAVATIPAPALTTYKSATCGCCKLWVDHASEGGFRIDAQDVADLNAIKAQYRIAPQYQSCHTSVSPEGFIFEGHVPARLVRQFLQDPPANALGLAVPGMPLGSPGMEVGDRFTPYQVLLLHRDGSHSVYASIEQPDEQY